MLKPLLWASLLTAFVSGCAPETPRPSEPAPDPVCPGSRAARADLAATLADTPDAVIVTPWGERVVRSGARLIDIVDARCAE